LERVTSWKRNGSTEQKASSAASRNCETLFDYDAKQRRAAEIEGLMVGDGFWNNQEKAQATVSELKGLKSLLKPIEDVTKSVGDLDGMLELADEEPSFAEEVKQEIARLEELLSDLELKGLLDGPHDNFGAIMSIYARDGGTDAHDWADMMLRMYSYWAKAHDFEVALLDRSDNEEAGINSASIAIRGPMAYGYLKGETGIHRLVRISPFNAEGKRQTSFAAVDVNPEVDDNVEIKVDWDKDVLEQTTTSQGAGGQHVNKTESAVRLVHIATGLEVKCQQERSQHKNRATARKLLLAKLARLEEEKREQESAAKYKNQARVGFGSQIRNYFLHPDQRVKDARTGYSENNFHYVLNGNIQGFLDAYLRWRASGQKVVAGGDD
jgi:peptide chain release factor 2